MPGPGEYTSQNFLFKNLKGSQKQLFGVSSKRFDKSDTLPPGPGQYIKAEVEVGVKHKPGKKSLKVIEGPQHLVIPSVVNKPGLQGEQASFRSQTQREIVNLLGKDTPGVGHFNIKDHLSIGVQKI